MNTHKHVDLLIENSKEYRKEILFPVMQLISRQHGQADLYAGLISDLDPVAMPRGATEMEVKMRQVRRKFLHVACLYVITYDCVIYSFI